MQSQFLIAKYSDPNGPSTDVARMKCFYSIFQGRFFQLRRHVENLSITSSHFDQSVAQGQGHKSFRYIAPFVGALKIFDVAKELAGICRQTPVKRLHFLGAQENPRSPQADN